MDVSGNPLGCVSLGRECENDGLLEKGYKAFDTRQEPMNFDEAKLVGKEEMVNLYRFRQGYDRGSRDPDSAASSVPSSPGHTTPPRRSLVFNPPEITSAS